MPPQTTLILLHKEAKKLLVGRKTAPSDPVNLKHFLDWITIKVTFFHGFEKNECPIFSCPDFIHSVHNDRKTYLFQGFPCNQFARQEPAANYTELYNGMRYVRPGMQRGYPFVPFFPLTKKLEVNGKGAHPIFNHLKVNHLSK